MDRRSARKHLLRQPAHQHIGGVQQVDDKTAEVEDVVQVQAVAPVQQQPEVVQPHHGQRAQQKKQPGAAFLVVAADDALIVEGRVLVGQAAVVDDAEVERLQTVIGRIPLKHIGDGRVIGPVGLRSERQAAAAQHPPVAARLQLVQLHPRQVHRKSDQVALNRRAARRPPLQPHTAIDAGGPAVRQRQPGRRHKQAVDPTRQHIGQGDAAIIGQHIQLVVQAHTATEGVKKNHLIGRLRRQVPGREQQQQAGKKVQIVAAVHRWQIFGWRTTTKCRIYKVVCKICIVMLVSK